MRLLSHKCDGNQPLFQDVIDDYMSKALPAKSPTEDEADDDDDEDDEDDGDQSYADFTKWLDQSLAGDDGDKQPKGEPVAAPATPVPTPASAVAPTCCQLCKKPLTECNLVLSQMCNFCVA